MPLSAKDDRRQPQLRRARDRTPLGRIVGSIEYAFGTGEYERAAQLIEEYMLQAWFGFDPADLGEMLSVLSEHEASDTEALRALAAVIAPTRRAGMSRRGGAPKASSGPARDKLMLAAEVFMLRLQGRPREAMRIAATLDGKSGALQPLFDRGEGWSLFAPVQYGITAMLAGDFFQAQESFTRARMHALVPSLAFLNRDASAKLAVVEAMYGDPARARALLAEADDVPRTESWAEAGVDASCTIARALMAEDPSAGLALLEAVPVRLVGELWPFYVVAVQRLLVLADRADESARRTEMFEKLHLPRTTGEGYTGSALPLAAAMNAMVRGDLLTARRRLDEADGEIIATRVLRGPLELAAGQPREALRIAVGLGDQTQGLRTLELWRLATIASSHFALGETQECREVLQHLAGSPGGFGEWEAQMLPDDVRAYAEEHVEGWPRVSGSTRIFATILAQRESLTARELEVLRALATGRTREEIARAQFISLNTLKAHLRAVYRKLGVSSRTAAVLEAERRGIL